MTFDPYPAILAAAEAAEKAIASQRQETPGGHVIVGHPLSGHCEACGISGAMLQAYGFPTCAGCTDVVDGDAIEVRARELGAGE